MVLLENFWDDVVAGPHPNHQGRLENLRRVTKPRPLKLTGEESNSSWMPKSPTTPPTPGRKENVWRSVFHPGSNIATKSIGAALFDKPEPNSPTVYDWLYSDETRSIHR